MEPIEELCRQIKDLWQEHRAERYPKQLYDFEEVIPRTSLVLLDADIAGCVSTFVSTRRNYTLDLWRTALLGRCYREAALVLLHLPEELQPRFARLETMAGLVLEVVGRKAQEAEETQG